jgi:ligand-binding sensor domain-containing protein
VHQAGRIARYVCRPPSVGAAALLFIAAISTAIQPTVGFAADLRNVLDGYTIASWTRRDGLPTTHVRALAQDHEGYLWIGTDAGLLRFDGVQFVPWEVVHGVQLPARSVRALLTSHDGSMWVGFAEDGGIVRLQPNGRVHVFGEADGLGIGREFLCSFAEDQRGQIWVGRSDGLYRFAEGAWERWTPGHGVGPGPVRSTHVDAHGALIIGTDDGVFRSTKDGEIFERINDSSSPVRSIAADRLNRLWVTDPRTGVKLVGDHHTTGEHPERGVGGHIIADRDGYL